MAGPIKTFTVSVEPRSFARAIEELSGRQVAARLRAAGNEIVTKSNALSEEFEDRTEERRRHPGTPQLRNSFEVHYTGLDQVRIGAMKFWLSTKAPSFWFLEYGTPPHRIEPHPGKRLWWPGTLLPPGVGVDHPGSRKWQARWRQLIARSLRDRFPGIKIPIIK